MEEPEINEGAAPADKPSPSRQKRRRAETTDFDFDALLNRPASRETNARLQEMQRPAPPQLPVQSDWPEPDLGFPATTTSGESSHIPRPEMPPDPDASDATSVQGPTMTAAQRSAPHRNWWPFFGVVGVAAAILGVVSFGGHRQSGTADKATQKPPVVARQTPAPSLPATPSVPVASASLPESSDPGEETAGGKEADPRGPLPMQSGRLRLEFARSLVGPFSYWFVADTGKSSGVRKLPRRNTDGQIVVTVPIAYNRPNAQIRLLDLSTGRVARLPVVDMSHSDVVVEPQVGKNLLRAEQTADNPQIWTLENNVPAHGTMQVLDALEGPAGATGKVLRLEVTALGTENWHVQCYQAGVNLREGRSYLLSFWAKADRPRKLVVTAILDQADWHSLGLGSSVDLTAAWKKYMVPFVASHVVPNHGRVSFCLGDALGTVNLANISLRRGSGRSVARAGATERVADLTSTDFQ